MTGFKLDNSSVKLLTAHRHSTITSLPQSTSLTCGAHETQMGFFYAWPHYPCPSTKLLDMHSSTKGSILEVRTMVYKLQIKRKHAWYIHVCTIQDKGWDGLFCLTHHHDPSDLGIVEDFCTKLARGGSDASWKVEIDTCIVRSTIIYHRFTAIPH